MITLQLLKDMLVVLIVLVAVYLLGTMFYSELAVVIDPAKVDDMAERARMLTGLKQYYQGFGLILLMAGAGFILVEYDDQLKTSLN